jgi:uncharacterized protein
VEYPGVYVEEVPNGARAIEGVPTSTALFIGWTARGPLDRAVELSCFAEYERQFGGPDPRAWLGYAVRHFFLNGGEKALVIRIASEGATPASARIDGLTVDASSSGAWGNGLWIERTETGATFRLDVRDGSAEGRHVPPRRSRRQRRRPAARKLCGSLDGRRRLPLCAGNHQRRVLLPNWGDGHW